MTGPITVTTDNFVRAETDRMFGDIQALSGGVGHVSHFRAPADVAHQTVVRMNRDTLYSWAVVDLNDPVTVTVPDAGARYLSVMVVDNDHYIDRVIYEPGDHVLHASDFGTRYVMVLMRTLVDASSDADIAAVHAVQDGLTIRGGAMDEFVGPAYDTESLDGVRAALLELGRFMPSAARCFGSRSEVDPVRHLVGAAIGWGGLPDAAATYENVEPHLPVGEYRLTVGDVPVDAFWSISVYDKEGFFVPNEWSAYNVNSVDAAREADGSVVVHFGGPDDGRSNRLPITDGWNYIVRLYRPHAEILDGSWTFPTVEAI